MGKEKKYRPNVAAIILSPKYPFECKLFIANRSDVKDAWQFPQGGIDEGESPREALLRELEEEIGTNAVDIIAEHPSWISYDFPDNVAKRMYPFDGQIQKYFLVKLRGSATVNINTEIPEFTEFKFVEASKIFDHVTYFKRPVYKEVLNYFKKEGYL